MMSKKVLMITAISAFALGNTGLVFATNNMNEEITVSIDEVPPVALVAAQRAAPGVALTEAGVDVDESGVGVYELSGDGVEIDVTVHGNVVEVEKEISDNEVPGVVMEALENRVPGLQVTLVEESLRKSLRIFYEFEGETEDGSVLDVEISEDGGQVVIQEDTAG